MLRLFFAPVLSFCFVYLLYSAFGLKSNIFILVNVF